MLFTTNSNDVFSGARVEEAGDYNVKVLSTSTLTKTKTNGNPMITLNYEVIDGKYQGGQIRYDNQTWVDYDQESHAQSVKRFNTLLKATGLQDGIQIDTMQQLLNLLVGKTMSIKVEWEQGNNGYYNLRVKQHNSVLQGGSKPNGQKAPDTGTDNFNSGNGGFSSNFGGGNFNALANSPQNAPQGNLGNQWGNNRSSSQNGLGGQNGANADPFAGQPQSFKNQALANQDQPVDTTDLPFANPQGQSAGDQVQDAPF